MGSYTATYRVPKEKVCVRLVLRNETAHRFELFLPIQQERRPPGQILEELLEQDRPFFPGWDLDEGEFVLICRDAVVWAELEMKLDRELGQLELYEYKQRVQVVLSQGEAFEGDVYYSAPSSKARLMDHLNAPERFVFLHTEDSLVLINKHFIEVVKELPTRCSTQQLPAVTTQRDSNDQND